MRERGIAYCGEDGASERHPKQLVVRVGLAATALPRYLKRLVCVRVTIRVFLSFL